MNRGPLVLQGKAGALAALTAAGMLWMAQTAPAQTATDQPASTAPAAAKQGKKNEKVVPSTDTKKQLRKEQKTSKKNPLVGLNKDSPDKQLYDKAQTAIKNSRFDVARMDLQVLLNTYPDSQYQMLAKLAVADSWFHEGGTAALDQAEAEYKDFITFFPNDPMAAEAQMRVGDIYFREMDKPDRDDAKALGAEREYRIMLQQFPDAPKNLVEQATQRLRDVQEALATREAEEGDFYAGHENRYAAIAHYQTVVDTYPLYSHMDDVLIALGDQYEAMARAYHLAPNPEGVKSIMAKHFHDAAALAYDRVVLEHAASPHVEDAKDRLASMNRPIPVPTKDELEASEALENSRSSYSIASRASLLFLHRPDVVQAARLGTPTLEDPKPTLAPDVVKEFTQDLEFAVKGVEPPLPAIAKGAAVMASATEPAPASPGTAPAAAMDPGSLKLEDVPTAKVSNSASSSTTVMTMAPATTTSGGGSGTSVGLRIVTPTNNTGSDAAPATAPASGAAPAATNTGLAGVGPTDNKAMPPIEKAADAPTNQVNEIQPGTPSTANTTNTTATASNKKPKDAPVDTSQESSSKKKKKKGLAKLNPF